MSNEPTPAFCLREGALEAIIQPAQGGRVAELRYAGVNRILPPGRVLGFHGDTFWPSPQSRFDWPPPPILDDDPYAVIRSTHTSATVQSAADEQFGFQVEKDFTVQDNAIHFTFRLTNIWDHPQSVAPWQITRAPREGTLFWAAGELFSDEDRLIKQREDSGCYFLHEKEEKPFPAAIARDGPLSQLCVRDVPNTCKLFANAQGWLAHLQDNCLILRRFPNLNPAQIAPRQGEIELYFNPELNYIEVENQGVYETLQPAQTLTYQTAWYFRSVDETHRSSGRKSILNTIQHLLAQDGS